MFTINFNYIAIFPVFTHLNWGAQFLNGRRRFPLKMRNYVKIMAVVIMTNQPQPITWNGSRAFQRTRSISKMQLNVFHWARKTLQLTNNFKYDFFVHLNFSHECGKVIFLESSFQLLKLHTCFCYDPLSIFRKMSLMSCHPFFFWSRQQKNTSANHLTMANGDCPDEKVRCFNLLVTFLFL